MSGSAKQSMGESDSTSITVRGFDLCDDLLGKIDFTEMIFLETVGRMPTVKERTVLNAALVCLTEHGMTPTAIAARLTLLGAPGSIQGALAAGVLGAGEVFLGAVENAAQFLGAILESSDEHSRQDTAREAISRHLEMGLRIPGLGHPIHKPDDPRASRLFRLIEELDAVGPAQRLMVSLRSEAERASGKSPLPINADGACAAILVDIGFSPIACRGFAVVSRCAGVLGHILDEIDSPAAAQIWSDVETNIRYERPVARF